MLAQAGAGKTPLCHRYTSPSAVTLLDQNNLLRPHNLQLFFFFDVSQKSQTGNFSKVSKFKVTFRNHIEQSNSK